MAREKGLTPKMRAGYSTKTAKSQGQRLLTNVDIAKAIAAAMKARSERTEVTQDDVLRELARIAFFDIGNAVTPDGSLKPLDAMDEDTRRALAGIEVNEIRDADGVVIGFVKKIKLADKLRALELLDKHLGMFGDRIKVSGDSGNPLVLLIKIIQGSAFNPVKMQPVRSHLDDEQTSTY